ncbi:probable G-protein coupled receptor 63 [Erpetoichthys calabaricus]|uniref:G protein-coupled receptor 63 n=1 Tax=Erpetoichthys calabaricus TaxID=27687 RepID=A0A8C4RQS1_ERPCA|nr:probable G-protein coupled receptor 63 [Erpetoichthys calabaricus]XP_028653399.1 probable G-protein coupled receptor 63 [Erpetoichthys calabaricus]XP_051781528.1 probable G-protein coupled receptor 63 [Erpetoichthys calabaricus]XP_051781529.1 probable G-protein coupled receptor 63 [Erpetoichthys calabaricus]XP_051781531.1 probable G-protein coupled receptor 63 [Erpetoichthys calabaricus]XP_051781532.1 probable G-protein coupled receptor 63 [Erpetoichthys calabaricus]
MVYSAYLPSVQTRVSNETLNSNNEVFLNSTTPYFKVQQTESRSPMASSSTETTTSPPSTQESFQSLSLSLQVVLSIIMISIFLVSFLGNVVVCLMVYQRAAMRSAINILLASLAFADMMLAILNMPFALVTIIIKRWIFGPVFCMLSAMLFWLFVIEGAAVLLIISIDRFLIIVQKQDRLNPHRAKILIGISWAISFCFSFPLAVGKSKLPILTQAPQCVFGYTEDPGIQAYVVLIVLSFFFIPFMVMLYTFMGILNTVRHNAIRIHSHSDSICLSQASKLGLMSLQRPFQMNIDMSFKTRAFTTILILFVVFTVCMAPFSVYSLISTFNNSFYNKPTFFEISTWILWLCYLKCALNPLIYYWRIKKFRDACLDLMPKYFKFLPQLPGHTRRRIRPSAIYVCGEHRSVV